MQMFFSKKSYFNVILFIVTSFLFLLSIETDFFHNHDDLSFHSNCPACQWLIISVFVFSVICIFFDLLLNFETFFLDVAENPFITSFYNFQYLRSPPDPAL